MIIKREIFEEEFLPDEDFLHRHEELNELSRALDPAARGERAEDVLVSGPSGVGKTSTVRHVLRTLKRETYVPTARIRCLDKSRAGVFYDAIQQHPRDAAKLPNAPADELYETLADIVTTPYILVLDEADSLHELDVLRELLAIPLLSVIVITHDVEEWRNRLDAQLRSRFLTTRHMHLDRYATGELAEILDARSEAGLEPNVISDLQLVEIADEVAGVAREGIQSLREAALLADERNHDEIRDDDVADSYMRARARIRRANLRSMGYAHHIVYELVRQEGKLKMGELWTLYETHAPELYRDRDQEPVSTDRQILNYLEKLIEYDAVCKEGENRWRTYYPVDPDLTAPGSIPERVAALREHELV